LAIRFVFQFFRSNSVENTRRIKAKRSEGRKMDEGIVWYPIFLPLDLFAFSFVVRRSSYSMTQDGLRQKDRMAKK
jgi:hypothetical protein